MNDFSANMLSRRKLLVGLALGTAAVATGCTSERAGISSVSPYPSPRAGARFDPRYLAMYGPEVDEGYSVPAVDLRRVKPLYYRQEVDNITGEAPGTVVIDTPNKFAYFTLPNGRAMRYGVGVGRAGFAWGGNGVIQWKKKWPTWTPPSEMIARQPELSKFADGMEPGLNNPLGARALYIFEDGQDTLYRLHGSPEYWTIGTNASSGCIRFMNQDIIDLYDRVPAGTRIVVRQPGVA